MKLLRHRGNFEDIGFTLDDDPVVYRYLRCGLKEFAEIPANFSGALIALLSHATGNHHQQDVRRETYRDEQRNNQQNFPVTKHSPMMRTEYPTIRMRLQHLSCGFHLWGVALLYSCMLKLATVLFLLAFVTAGHAQYIPRFDVQGHRGARVLKPENSIPAFLTALDYGVTTLELDLAVTSYRRLVVSHEPWMSAAICLTPDGKPISRSREKAYNIYEMTYEVVAAFDCGSRGNKAFPDQQ